MSHYRILQWSLWFAALGEFSPADRMYNCLPLYHSVGGVVAIGSVLAAGGSVAIAEKFSATRFWPDVVQFKCTLFQYIGELCPYLVNAPRAAEEGAHSLRLAAANHAEARFEGYTDHEETERKILRDVFEPGDAWYRTGDLMRMDEGGFIYFVDRIGDTFRWKAENVSTSEVEQALSSCPGVLNIVVYGVSIPDPR